MLQPVEAIVQYLVPVRPEATRPAARVSSPIERLLETIDGHARVEAQAQEQYARLAQTGDPVIALVMQLILQDEERHHALLQRIAASLRDGLTWSASDNALPTVLPASRAIPRRSLTTVRELLKEERAGAQLLWRMAAEEHDINGGLDALLLEMMARDSEQLASLLRFVVERLAAREWNAGQRGLARAAKSWRRAWTAARN
jgi:hypothetical protein